MLPIAAPTISLVVGNIHCPSCVASIQALLAPPLVITSPRTQVQLHDVAVSALTGVVSFTFAATSSSAAAPSTTDATLLRDAITKVAQDVLIRGGFEVCAAGDVESLHRASSRPQHHGGDAGLPATQRLRALFERRSTREKREKELEQQRWSAHLKSCAACQAAELSGVVVEPTEPEGKGKQKQVAAGAMRKTTLVLEGLTCASCVGAVERLLVVGDGGISERTVTLLPPRAVVLHSVELEADDLAEMIEEGGYGAQVVETLAVELEGDEDDGWKESKFAIEGMTCSSCVSAIVGLFPIARSGVRSFTLTLLPPVATLVHDPRMLPVEKALEDIEEAGYEAQALSSAPVVAAGAERKQEESKERTVKVKVDGMFCINCVNAINSHLSSLRSSGHLLSFSPIALASPISTIVYLPRPTEGVTLRSFAKQIEKLGPFKMTPLASPSDQLTLFSRASQARELRSTTIRVAISFAFAIPTFIIAVVGMSILPLEHPFRQYCETTVWGSRCSRGTVALFALATPVQFGVGWVFYQRSWKSLRSVWRAGQGSRRWMERSLRWGSMNTLVAFGTTAGWIASVAYMALDVVAPPSSSGGHSGMGMGMEEGLEGGGTMSYFDTSVFLMFFILLGRLLEGYSKRQTGREIEALGELKPKVAVLYHPTVVNQEDDEKSLLSMEKDGSVEEVTSAEGGPSAQEETSEVEINFVELGDVLLVRPGASVPLDARLVDLSPSSTFDEASITGESRPVHKAAGDDVFAGTINLGPRAVFARVTKPAGETMIDEIVRIVRDSMAKKAGLERLADTITAYFVPVIVYIALFTFVVWAARGYAGDLPSSYLGEDAEVRGGWILFAVKFAVAVLVVACPCGIGLAAPTAQLVGIGLCARLGIVPYGGGSAFQAATGITIAVFDKTGTITEGQFSVTQSAVFEAPASTISHGKLWSALAAIEQLSTHPIAVALHKQAQTELAKVGVAPAVQVLAAEEVPGRGFAATVQLGGEAVEVLVGNEKLLLDKAGNADSAQQLVDPAQRDLVEGWHATGHTVIFLALRDNASGKLCVSAMFGLSDPIRPSSALVIRELQRRGVAVYMCTGDTRATADVVASQVGIEPTCVIAGVLPTGKKETVEILQRNGRIGDSALPAAAKPGAVKRLLKQGGTSRQSYKVLFVGDGVNDSPSLATADVGVSMGSGTSLAMSTSDFCLLSSNLTSLLSLLSVTRATHRKILTNFAWACIFNVALIPIAAGAFYDLPSQVTLPPVWASLAMALSSVSVVTNSLALRWFWRAPKTAN